MRIIPCFWIGIIATALLYLGLEVLWYLRVDFAWLHRLHAWSTSHGGIELRAFLFCGIIGLAIVTGIVQTALTRRAGKNETQPGSSRKGG